MDDPLRKSLLEALVREIREVTERYGNPYAPPTERNDVPSNEPPATEFMLFRVRFLPVLLFLFIVGGLVATILTVPPERHHISWFFLIGLSLFASIAGTLLVVFQFPIYVHPRGIRCYDFWGQYAYVDWMQINRVSKSNFFGFRYLKLHSALLRRPLWLPLFLRRHAEFWSLISQYELSPPLRTASTTRTGKPRS